MAEDALVRFNLAFRQQEPHLFRVAALEVFWPVSDESEKDYIRIFEDIPLTI